MRHAGWRHSFEVFGGPGTVWTAVFCWRYRDDPRDNPRLNASERELVRKGRHTAIESSACLSVPPLSTGGLGNPPSALGCTGFIGAAGFPLYSTTVGDLVVAMLAIAMASFSNDLVMPGAAGQRLLFQHRQPQFQRFAAMNRPRFGRRGDGWGNASYRPASSSK